MEGKVFNILLHIWFEMLEKPVKGKIIEVLIEKVAYKVEDCLSKTFLIT